MDLLSDDFQNLLYTKEWAVKVDASQSQPYLIKSFSSKTDTSCGVVITDTKSVWTEVLPGQHFARRWRKCNSFPLVSDAPFDLAENDWRAHNAEVLANAHTPGCIQDFDFEIVETKFSDLACTIEGASFQWRWETNYIGHRQSAEFISKHLILPLISLSNLAFISPGLANMTDDDVEKSVDKLARTSKRTPDIYIKNVLSKPKISSTLARLNAAVNLPNGFPPVKSEYDTTELQPLPPPNADEVRNATPDAPQKGSPMADVRFNPNAPAIHVEASAPTLPSEKPGSSKAGTKAESPLPDLPPAIPGQDSDTEDEDSDDALPPPPPSKAVDSKGKSKASTPVPVAKPSPSPAPPKRAPPRRRTAAPSSSSDESSPVQKPPSKKTKPPVSSEDSDSDKAPVVKKGTRQPLKRGGKRF
ncbi:hypothetical protein CYLTODRAFT_417986 [Cylindrobasidium torrendii FP15055 ss-10]|uniref:XLF-like N-terminal domain-containing protein n=1 Tax=Cylindrobasidium torrendii FP15055 ss-10 TaxID=1314674 RepID=A0A0D7BQF4_9AGAR|nr:hypothetical protein CYLTODRAFT_417986 [Cylindrobasidium torrendii FP15055 ss-10]